MSDSAQTLLLAPDEPHPVITQRLDGRSSFVLVVDHAGARIPRRLGDLGLPKPALERHIAWDIGALGLAQRISDELDAPLVAQAYSRLVIDCNRDPAVASSIPTHGESWPIPGNIGLSAAEVSARRAELFEPYHGCIAALLSERASAGRPTILVAQHSMTDELHGVRRAMHAAVLHDRDPGFARCVLAALRREAALQVAENEPYALSDQSDYTVPRHAEARGLPYVEIEVRQDLLRDSAGQQRWAARIVRALREAESAWRGRPASPR